MDFPFTTDGCSGGLSWYWRLLHRKAPPWEKLCVEHERAYHAGGTRAARCIADQDLFAAMIKRGHPWWGIAMYAAVRLGGHPLLPTSWRWGYGWKYPHGYE